MKKSSTSQMVKSSLSRTMDTVEDTAEVKPSLLLSNNQKLLLLLTTDTVEDMAEVRPLSLSSNNQKLSLLKVEEDMVEVKKL